jgi:hypothetical protein
MKAFMSSHPSDFGERISEVIRFRVGGERGRARRPT